MAIERTELQGDAIGGVMPIGRRTRLTVAGGRLVLDYTRPTGVVVAGETHRVRDYQMFVRAASLAAIAVFVLGGRRGKTS